VVSGLARSLTDLGHPVRVFAPHPVKGAAPRQETIDGIPIVRVRSLPVPVYAEYRWGVFPFFQLRGQHLDQVDVVHLHTTGILGSTGFLASRYFDKPLVGTFHTNVWEMRHSFRTGPLARLFFRSAWIWTLGTYWRCDVTTAPTASARDALVHHARKPFRRPIEIIPNGIPLTEFHPGVATPDWRVRCGLPTGPLVTYLGRLTVDKGVHRFLSAVKAVSERRPIVAIIGGSGPEENALRDELNADSELSKRVRYVGPIAEEEKAALLGQSDLFVLPSTSDTSSVAVMEAMACGVPVLVSNVGGPAEIVEDGVTGRQVDPLNASRVAEAITELLDRPAERRQLASHALEFVARHGSIEATARRFISLYEHLLEAKGGHAARDRR
jgi:glycosyltransferase involved in cell wall biosynthesis